MGWLYGTIILLSLLGAISGWLFTKSTNGMAWGIVAGVFLALWVSIGKIAKLIYPDSFIEYASEERTEIVERVVLVISVDNISKKMIHGFSRDELQLIGKCVTHNGAYEFSVQHFNDYFKNSGINGYSLYSRSVRWMKDSGALVPNAKGGVDVTEIGQQVFDAMRDGSWEEIKETDSLPLPTM